METAVWVGAINFILLIIAALGFWGKLSAGFNVINKWLKFSKEWLDVAMVFIKAVADGEIDATEAEEILKEWEEAKNSGKLPESFTRAARFRTK